MTTRRAAARLAGLWPLLPLAAGSDWPRARARWAAGVRALADADGDGAEQERAGQELLALATELPSFAALLDAAGTGRRGDDGPAWPAVARALVSVAEPGGLLERASLTVAEELGPYAGGQHLTDTLLTAGIAAALGLGRDDVGRGLREAGRLAARPSFLDGAVPPLVPWSDPLPWLAGPSGSAHLFGAADAWQLRVGPGVRLLLGDTATAAGPGTETAALLSLGTHVASVVHTLRADPSAPHRWSWPVRLAVAPGPGGAAEPRRGLLAAAGARSELITPVAVTGRWNRPSLLLLPHAPDDGPAAPPDGPPATAVVVVSESPGPVPTVEEMRSLAVRHRSSVAARAHCGPSARRWLEALLDGLAQDLPLDIALYGAARACAAFAPVVAADPRFLDSTRIRPVLAAFPRDALPPAAEARVGRMLRGGSPAGPDGPLPETAADLRASAHRARTLPTRFLWAGVTGPDGSGPYGVTRPYDDFHVKVRLVAGLRAGSGQPRFPADALPPGPSHDLTVIASDLGSGPGSRSVMGTIVLTDDDDSTAVLLRFKAGAGGAAIRIRIAVAHRSRLLQSGLLTGRVGAREAPVFRVDSVPRAATDDLDLAEPHDAAVLLDRAADGRTVVTTSTPWFIGRGSVPDPRRTLRTLLRRLKRLVDDPDGFDDFDGYESPGFGELMTDLARSGRRLGRTLFGVRDWNGDGWVRTLREARSITVSSAGTDMILPLEFVYDRELDAGRGRSPRLCPDAPALVNAADCAGCPRRDDPSTVCPFGFWGASKVIERHIVRGSDGSGYALAVNPAPGRHSVPLTRVCAAAAERADHNDVRAWTAAAAALTAQWSEAVRLADDWAGLEALVTRLRENGTPPGAVLLFPHTQEDDGVTELSLAEGDTVDIRDGLEFLFGRDDRPQPLVLLLGCATAGGATPFSDASGALLADGAPGVVATAVPVRGRHIVPVGVRLLAELRAAAAGSAGSPLGLALMRSRRKLLTRGDACVLALVGFGDTDWEATT